LPSELSPDQIRDQRQLLVARATPTTRFVRATGMLGYAFCALMLLHALSQSDDGHENGLDREGGNFRRIRKRRELSEFAGPFGPLCLCQLHYRKLPLGS